MTPNAKGTKYFPKIMLPRGTSNMLDIFFPLAIKGKRVKVCVDDLAHGNLVNLEGKERKNFYRKIFSIGGGGRRHQKSVFELDFR